MGVEHAEEDLHLHSIRELAAMLADYSQTLIGVADKMQARNVESFPVKHMTKARTSVKKLGEFTTLVSQTLGEYMFRQAFPDPAKVKKVAERSGTYDYSKDGLTRKQVVKKVTKATEPKKGD